MRTRNRLRRAPKGWQMKVNPEDRKYHTYIVGTPGFGKTNLIKLLALQDMARGGGVGVMTSKGGLVRYDLPAMIPEHRLRDVIVFDPTDEKPVPFNIFQLGKGGRSDALAYQLSGVIAQTVGGTGGVQMRTLLMNCLRALSHWETPTLYDLVGLLHPKRPEMRERVIEETTDAELRDYFESYYPQVEQSAWRIIARLQQDFLHDPLKTLLSSPATFDLRQAMDEGKIILFDLSKGMMGGSEAILGQMIIAKLLHAATSREDYLTIGRTPPPFYMYIDEFQDFEGFASDSVEQMMAQAREFNLCLHLAHQYRQQLKNERVRGAVEGAGTKLILKPHNSADESFFARVLSLPEQRLRELEKGQFFYMTGSIATKVRSPKAEDIFASDPDIAQQVRENSRRWYGIEGAVDIKNKYAEYVREQKLPEQEEEYKKLLDPEELKHEITPD